MPSLLILGATSDMARATAILFARRGWDLLLASRDLSATESVGRDVALRSGRAQDAFPCFVFEALRPEDHQNLWESLPICPDAVLCVVGGGGDAMEAQNDLSLAERIMRINFTGLVPILLLAANAFEARRRGLIIGVGSVAGDRGRAANYLYGSAKAGFATFLAGLRNRLARNGVTVITVKPGPAYTRMSAGLALSPVVTAHPEEIANAILRASRTGQATVYVKPIWRLIMWAIRLMPDPLFNQMNLAVRKER